MTTSPDQREFDAAAIHRRAAAGAGWTLAFRLADRAVGVISVVILARLLTPADLGLMALAMSLLAVLEVFGDLGVDLALIRNQEAGRGDYDTAWTLELARGVIAAGVLTALAAPAAAFFKDSRVELIVYWLAVASVLRGSENIAIVDFRKNFQFHREFAYLLCSRLLSVLVGTILAYAWRDYWALVAGLLAHRLARLGLSYLLVSYRPRLSLVAVRDILRFSRWIVLRHVLMGARRYTPAFVLGRISGAAPLALYEMAFELANLVTTEFRAPVRRALLPAYARLAPDIRQLRSTFVETFALLVLIALPIPIGIGLTAPFFVPVLLGPKWFDTIPLIQILALHGVVQCLGFNSSVIYLALNRPRLATLVSAVNVAAFVPLLIAGALWIGVVGAAWATVVGSTLTMVMEMALIVRVLGVSSSDLVRAIWRPLGAAAIMASAVFALQSFQIPTGQAGSATVQLVTSVTVGVGSYVTGLIALWSMGGRPAGAERDLLNVLQQRRRAGRYALRRPPTGATPL